MSIVSNKSGSTPIFYYSKVGATSLNVVNNSLDSLYEFPKVAPTEDGQVIAFNTDGSSSFVDNTAINALTTDTPLITPTQGSVIISDGLSSTGTNKSEDLIIRDYGVIDIYKQLNCNDALNIQSLTTLPVTMTSGTDDFIINNTQGSRTVFINSGSYFFDNNVITSENVILNQGKSLTLNNDTDPDNVKLYKANGALGNFVLDNQSGSKTDFRGASSYQFSNDVSIGDNTTTKKLYLNNVEITPSGSGVSAGMLRALSLNLLVPTVAQTYNVVWTNLSAEEQLLWKGGDASTADPIASATGNYWSFVKTAGTSKINWTPPIDLSSLSFQDLQSVWAIVRINTTTGNLTTEGSLWFQIQSNNDPANPPSYRTRWNYSNAANPNSQTGYFIKLFALDTIPLSTSASNTGKGQETNQLKFKTNPCDVEPTLFSLGLNKFVVSPSGDISTPGYTLAPVQSVGLNTASNILSYNFDVIAMGVNNYRWNLSFA
jgi:hypothetical protein